MEPGEQFKCDLCGTTPYDKNWMSLEVARPQPGDVEDYQAHDYVEFLFCSVDHAREYFQKHELPPVKPVAVPPPSTRRENLEGWLIVLLVVSVALGTLFLLGLGAWTFVRHILG